MQVLKTWQNSFFALAVLSHPSVKRSTRISLESRTFFYHFSNVRAPSRGVNKVNKWKVRIWFYYSARVLDYRLLLDRPPYSQLFQKILSQNKQEINMECHPEQITSFLKSFKGYIILLFNFPAKVIRSFWTQTILK